METLNVLYNLGLSNNTIRTMVELNPSIKEMNNEEVQDKIEILKEIECSDEQIMNIISINSLYLNKTDDDIYNLINYLLEKGFGPLNVLFESNPFILNLEPFEIENYINKRRIIDEPLEDIIDDLESNPIIFNEI